MLLDEADILVTMRQEPSLALIQPTLSGDGQSLVLEAPGMEPLTVDLGQIAESGERLIEFRQVCPTPLEYQSTTYQKAIILVLQSRC